MNSLKPLLTATTAAALLLPVAQAQDTQDPHVEQFVEELDVLPGRTMPAGFKWGSKLKIQEMCPENASTYLITAENEEWREGDDAVRLLTTWWKFHPLDPQANWFRDDNLSTLIEKLYNKNSMSIYHEVPWTNVQVNNYTFDHEIDWLDERNHVSLWFTENAVDITTQVEGMEPCGDPSVHREQMQMHRWLRAGSDPFTKYTIDRVAQDDDSNIYEIVVYRTEDDPSAGWKRGESDPILIGLLDYSNNTLVRVDRDPRYVEFWNTEEPDFGNLDYAYYSEIYGWWPDEDCLERRLWKIDTESNASTWLPIKAEDGEGRRLEDLREGRHECLRYW